MLDQVDIIFYDIADVGTRCYTYINSLFYVMEKVGAYNNARAKSPIEVVVLDRPNPINGHMVDGPITEEEWLGLLSKMPMPVCHGMTSAELAILFNSAHNLTPCPLKHVPMKNWKREYNFADTALIWTPPSPNIPEYTTCLYYPITVIGEGFKFLNVGKNNTLPFKFIIAPWMDSEAFSKKVNQLLEAAGLNQVVCQDFTYTPSSGTAAGDECQGIYLYVKDPLNYKPVATQYIILEALQALYPEKIKTGIAEVKALPSTTDRTHMGKPLSAYNQIPWLMGTEKVVNALQAGNFNAIEAISSYQEPLNEFKKAREKVLLTDYN